MARMPLIIKIILAYLPAVIMLVIFSRYPWWVNLPVSLVLLFVISLLWVFLFDPGMKPVTKGEIDSDQLNSDLKGLLIESAGIGNAMVFSTNNIVRKTAAISQSIEHIVKSLEELSAGDLQAAASIGEIADRLKRVEKQMLITVEAGDKYLEYADSIRVVVEKGMAVSENPENSGKEIYEAGFGTERALKELALLAEKIDTVEGTIEEFARQANMMTLNTSLKTTKLEAVDKSFAALADEMNELAIFSKKSMEKISTLIGETFLLRASLKKEIKEAGLSLMSQNNHIGELQKALEEISATAGGTVQEFIAVMEINETLREEISSARTVAEGLFGISGQSVEGFEVAGDLAVEQKEQLTGIHNSALNLSRQIKGFRQSTDRYTIPKVGYIDRASDIAGAHLFKRWYKRDCGGEVILVEIDEDSVAEMYAAIAEGVFDSSISCWTPGMHDLLVAEHYGKIDLLGTNLAGARNGLLVPDYVTIGTIGVLQHNRDKFNSLIYAVGEEEEISLQAGKALQEYKVDFEIEYGTLAALTQILDRAIKNREWVAVTGWIPEPAFENRNLKFLSDPKRCFGGEKFVKTVVRKGLKAEKPHFYRALQRFRWSVEDASAFMAMMNQGQSPDETAVKMLEKISATLR